MSDREDALERSLERADALERSVEAEGRFIAYLIERLGGVVRVPLTDLLSMSDRPFSITYFDDPSTDERVYSVEKDRGEDA